MSATTARPFTTDDKVLYSGPTPEIDGKAGVVIGRWTSDESVIDVEFDGDRWSIPASRLTLVEQDDDLDEPVPYVPVSPRSVRHTNEPCDLTPQFSSQAGVAAHRYSPTRFGALIPSGGAVTQPNPAPSDAPSLVELDRQDAIVQAIRWALYTTPYAELGWKPEPGRFDTDDAASEHLARMIAPAVAR